MNIDKMEVLADFLDKLDPEKFDMSTWITSCPEGADPIQILDLRHAHEHKDHCNTRACVAGWACILWSESAPTAGLGFWNTAQDLLGLSNSEAQYLFSYTTDDDGSAITNHTTHTEAAVNIRRLVEHHKLQKSYELDATNE